MKSDDVWTIGGAYFVCEQTGERVDVPENMTSEEVESMLLRGERP